MFVLVTVFAVSQADPKLFKKLKKFKGLGGGLLPLPVPFVGLNLNHEKQHLPPPTHHVETVKEVQVVREVPIINEVVKEVPVEVVRKVPVDKIVYVDTPVERIEEVFVDKTVFVDRPVEIIKEVPFERVSINVVFYCDNH